MKKVFTTLADIPVVTIPENGVVRQSDPVLAVGGRLMKRIQIALPEGKVDAVVPMKAHEEEELRRKIEIPSDKPKLAELTLPKVPWDDPDGGFVQCWNYFSLVHQKQGSEAFVWWHWDRELGKYLTVVPAFYYATSGGLDYPTATHFCRNCRVALYAGAVHCPHCHSGDDEENNEDIQPLFILGTSHSHGRMSPFHSGTDHANELDVTGFHITFGELQRGPVIEGSFVVADGHTRFKTLWHDHVAFTMTDISWARVELWMTLVGNAWHLAKEANWAVVDSQGRPVFLHGEKSHCEVWVRCSGHPDDLTIVEGRSVTQARKHVSGRALTLTPDRTGESDARRRLFNDDEDLWRNWLDLEPTRKSSIPRKFPQLTIRVEGKASPLPGRFVDLITNRLPDVWKALGLRVALSKVMELIGLEDWDNEVDLTLYGVSSDVLLHIHETVTVSRGKGRSKETCKWGDLVHATVEEIVLIAEAKGNDVPFRVGRWMIQCVVVALGKAKLAPEANLVQAEEELVNALDSVSTTKELETHA